MVSAAELKALLRAHGLRLRKRLGQHHLVDPQVVRQLIQRGQFSRDEAIIEIGAGLGALTEPLAQVVSRVTALDVDQQFCDVLAQRMAAFPHVRVLCQDVLRFSWTGLKDVTVVGAIPYHITSPIVVALCEARQAIRRAILIVQHEVAQRLLASPGTKAYGRLSVLGQYGWRITRLFDVPRSAFFPQPAVDSCCVQFTARARPAVDVDDEAFFFQVVKAALAQRRKTLINCLSHQDAVGVPRESLEAMIQPLGFSPTLRGETLSIAQFASLANALRPQSRREKN